FSPGGPRVPRFGGSRPPRATRGCGQRDRRSPELALASRLGGLTGKPGLPLNFDPWLTTFQPATLDANHEGDAMNETKSCRACTLQIPAAAKRCPHCRTWNDPRRRHRQISYVSIVIGLAILILMARGWQQARDNAKDQVDCIRLRIDPRYCE